MTHAQQKILALVGLGGLALVVAQRATAAARVFSISDRLVAFAHAIAVAEGFYLAGSAPQLAHNPGALVNGDIGRGIRGLAGITNYVDDVDGWNALYTKLQDIGAGRSSRYSPTMTIAEMAATWTTTNRSAWAGIVAGALGVDSSAMIAPWVTA